MRDYSKIMAYTHGKFRQKNLFQEYGKQYRLPVATIIDSPMSLFFVTENLLAMQPDALCFAHEEMKRIIQYILCLKPRAVTGD